MERISSVSFLNALDKVKNICVANIKHNKSIESRVFISINIYLLIRKAFKNKKQSQHLLFSHTAEYTVQE